MDRYHSVTAVHLNYRQVLKFSEEADYIPCHEVMRLGGQRSVISSMRVAHVRRHTAVLCITEGNPPIPGIAGGGSLKIMIPLRPEEPC